MRQATEEGEQFYIDLLQAGVLYTWNAQVPTKCLTKTTCFKKKQSTCTQILTFDRDRPLGDAVFVRTSAPRVGVQHDKNETACVCIRLNVRYCLVSQQNVKSKPYL